MIVPCVSAEHSAGRGTSFGMAAREGPHRGRTSRAQAGRLGPAVDLGRPGARSRTRLLSGVTTVNRVGAGRSCEAGSPGSGVMVSTVLVRVGACSPRDATSARKRVLRPCNTSDAAVICWQAALCSCADAFARWALVAWPTASDATTLSDCCTLAICVEFCAAI